MLDLIGSTHTPVPVRGCQNLEIPWHRSCMAKRVVICHIANFLMEFEGSLLCSQVSQFSNPEPDESSSCPSIIHSSEGSCYSPVMCKIQKFYPRFSDGFPGVRTSFPLIGFCPSNVCMKFPLLSENHLNCFVFIHLF